MRKFLFALVGGLAFLAVPGPGYAARVEADPNKDYPVSPPVGPWMICAAGYSGEDARELARQLVYQLRRRDNLPAYYFNRGAEERLKQKEEWERYRQQHPQADLTRVKALVRIPDQYMVLVGGYADMDAARKALNDVKKLKLPELDLGPNKSAYDFTFDPRTGQRLAVNPLSGAFVAPNPTVPRQAPQQDTRAEEAFLKQLNSGETYSLFQCKKPWTLVLKEFKGTSTIETKKPASSSFLDKLGWGNKNSDLLNAGAMQANEIARVLRAMKLDGYVLHTRQSSLVCVGGFDGPDDPQLLQTQRTLSKGRIGGIELLNTPVPMQIPRPQ